MQFTGINTVESSVKLPLIFVLTGFKLSSNQGTEIINKIIEYQFRKDIKDLLVQPFLAKSQSRQDGLTPCPAES